MRTNKLWLSIAFALVIASTAGCHKPGSGTETPQQAQQAAIAARAFQINHSNLPPDQKQRLLNQIGAK